MLGVRLVQALIWIRAGRNGYLCIYSTRAWVCARAWVYMHMSAWMLTHVGAHILILGAHMRGHGCKKLAPVLERVGEFRKVLDNWNV